MPGKLDIMLKSYDHLRQEILESIGWQNKLIIAEVTVISVLLGLGISMEDPFRLLIVAIPPAVIALTAVWLIEQSRMMRASNYLQLLEDQINLEAGGKAYISWENWLRTGVVGKIHGIHHWSQWLGVIGVFYVLSSFSICRVITLGLLPWGVWLSYIVLLVLLLVFIILAVPHSETNKGQFKKWKSEYESKI